MNGSGSGSCYGKEEERKRKAEVRLCSGSNGMQLVSNYLKLKSFLLALHEGHLEFICSNWMNCITIFVWTAWSGSFSLKS